MNKKYKSFFKIEERGKKYGKYQKHWKYLLDKDNKIWGLFWTYKAAKDAIKILSIKYKEDLEKIGYFDD